MHPVGHFNRQQISYFHGTDRKVIWKLGEEGGSIYPLIDQKFKPKTFLTSSPSSSQAPLDSNVLQRKQYVSSSRLPLSKGLPRLLVVKNLLASEGDLRVVSIPGSEDPLEEGMATDSNILAWRVPIDRGTWWATNHGVAKRHHWRDLAHTHFCLEDSPLEYPCGSFLCFLQELKVSI